MWSQNQGYKALSTVSIGFLRQSQQFTPPPAVRPTQHKECVMVTGMFTAVADFQRHSNTAWLRLASYVRALVGVLDVGHMHSLESRWINAMPTPLRGCCWGLLCRAILPVSSQKHKSCSSGQKHFFLYTWLSTWLHLCSLTAALFRTPPWVSSSLDRLTLKHHTDLWLWPILMCFNLRGSLRLFPLCFLSYAQWVPGPHPAQDAEPFVSDFHVAPGSSEGQNTRTHNQTKWKI